jgi:hypothetical protein
LIELGAEYHARPSDSRVVGDLDRLHPEGAMECDRTGIGGRCDRLDRAASAGNCEPPEALIERSAETLTTVIVADGDEMHVRELGLDPISS